VADTGGPGRDKGVTLLVEGVRRLCCIIRSEGAQSRRFQLDPPPQATAASWSKATATRSPTVADRVTARPGRLGQQGREPLHPAIDRDMVDLDPAFGEQLLDVPVGQAKAQVLRSS
jgi:hypothetical protein